MVRSCSVSETIGVHDLVPRCNEVRDKLGIEFVQIGSPTDQILEGVTNLSGKTSFRQAAAVISKSLLHVGPEGGLMHAANAVGIKSVILITGFLHPRMTCYEENSNIWIGKHHTEMTPDHIEKYRADFKLGPSPTAEAEPAVESVKTKATWHLNSLWLSNIRENEILPHLDEDRHCYSINEFIDSKLNHQVSLHI